MSDKQDTWCSKEFNSVKLGDKRLDQRFLRVANDFLNSPAEPIHAICRDWSEAKAAYRLFDNDKFQEPYILQIHQQETIKRLKKIPKRVFAIQDTTTLNYTHHPKKKGLGKINKQPSFNKPIKGFFLHNTLLMTEEGLPVGLIDQKIYKHEINKLAKHKNRPITEKESYRWLESLRETQRLCPNRDIITIGDRESDIFELFLEAQELDAKVLIRAAHDRMLADKCQNKKHDTLWTKLQTTTLGSLQTIHLPARHNQRERLAKLEVRYKTIVLKPPQRTLQAKEKELLPVSIQAVWLYERNPPSDTTPLEWMLLTNMPVNSVEDAIMVGKWYRLRWQIECYHRVLKSGCKIEECRLETYERVKKYVRLKSIIAFRLFWLTFINRTQPEIPCNQILEDFEWKALYCYVFKTKVPPDKIPSIREAVRMIAKLGGFLGRRGDKEPGMTYIWRGWKKLALIADFWMSIS
jgi:hypothetical protein